MAPERTPWAQEAAWGPPPPPRPPAEPPARRPPDSEPAPRRRRWPWPARVAAGIGATVLVVLLAPSPLVDPLVDRSAGRYGGRCAEFSGLQVDSGSWPVVARAAAGQLRDVSAHTDTIRFENDFTIHDVDFSADEVNVPPLRFGMADQDAEVRGGRSSATVRLDDIERILAGHGVTVDLRGDGASMVADVQVPVVGVVPTTVDLVPVGGDLELRFAALDLIQLPSLLITFPDPVTFERADVRGGDMRVSTTVDGTITSGDWGCDTEATETSGGSPG